MVGTSTGKSFNLPRNNLTTLCDSHAPWHAAVHSYAPIVPTGAYAYDTKGMALVSQLGQSFIAVSWAWPSHLGSCSVGQETPDSFALVAVSFNLVGQFCTLFPSHDLLFVHCHYGHEQSGW